jgi:hypothetical protein
VPAPAQPPGAGTLTVTPQGGQLVVGAEGATLTLSAANGPVPWHITVTGVNLGAVTATPSSGTLASGASVTVLITAGLLAVGDVVTVSPGGAGLVIAIGLGHLPLSAIPNK